MFKQTDKVKNNTQLKGSDKKRLISKILDNFNIRKDELSTLIPVKESVTAVKLNVHKSEVSILYICQDLPLFFEYADIIYPTVFVIWKFPLIIPYILINAGVESRIFNGAHLMIPGVNKKDHEELYKQYPLQKIVYLNTSSNIAALAVGATAVEGSEIIIPGKKGKAVHVLHYFGDGISKYCESIKDIPSLGSSLSTFGLHNTVDISQAFESNILGEELKSENTEGLYSSMSDNDLLSYCFFKSLRKGINLPILTNIFYKNYMLEAVPHGMHLDLKKTTYKKLSVFLIEIMNKNIIRVEEQKGVQSITNVNFSHDLFKTFVDKFEVKGESKESNQDKTSNSLEIHEYNVVNKSVAEVFKTFGFKKGDTLSDQEVRKYVTQYIMTENLQNTENKELVSLNAILCDILQTTEDYIPWKNLFDSIGQKMEKTFEVRFSQSQQVIEGKGILLPIDVSVQVRTSNKKVTLVNNLELYGININEFGKECQQGVAASYTINPLANKRFTVNKIPNKNSAQLQIQGNQKKFIYRLLIDKYVIPKKYIIGCEDEKPKKS